MQRTNNKHNNKILT